MYYLVLELAGAHWTITEPLNHYYNLATPGLNFTEVQRAYSGGQELGRKLSADDMGGLGGYGGLRFGTWVLVAAGTAILAVAVRVCLRAQEALQRNLRLQRN